MGKIFQYFVMVCLLGMIASGIYAANRHLRELSDWVNFQTSLMIMDYEWHNVREHKQKQKTGETVGT